MRIVGTRSHPRHSLIRSFPQNRRGLAEHGLSRPRRSGIIGPALFVSGAGRPSTAPGPIGDGQAGTRTSIHHGASADFRFPVGSGTQHGTKGFHRSRVIPECGDSRSAEKLQFRRIAALHETDIRFAKGVGPKRALLLEKLGIRTIEDALWFLPWRYEDRSRIVSISQLVPQGKATIAGTIHQAGLRRTRRRNMTLFTMSVQDDTGAVEVVFFNQPYLDGVLRTGCAWCSAVRW